MYNQLFRYWKMPFLVAEAEGMDRLLAEILLAASDPIIEIFKQKRKPNTMVSDWQMKISQWWNELLPDIDEHLRSLDPQIL